MGRMQIVINDDIEKRFRVRLAREGLKKGDISREIERLIKKYLQKKEWVTK